jgi:hypothetical protein
MSRVNYAYMSSIAYLSRRGNGANGKALFWCELCTKLVEADEVVLHCIEARHMQGAKNVHNSPLAFGFINLHSRIEQLGSSWQMEIKAKLYDSFLRRDLVGPSFDSTNAIQEANELVDEYEDMERSVLLELAVWKAMCIATFQSKPESQSLHDLLDWMRHGWKDAKSKTQGCSEIEIITDAVDDFLY